LATSARRGQNRGPQAHARRAAGLDLPQPARRGAWPEWTAVV